MATNIVNLQVTADYVIPPILINASPEVCVNVLTAGVSALESATANLNKSTNATLTAKHEAALTRQQKEAEAERLRLQKEIERLQGDVTLAKSQRTDAENRLTEAIANARRLAYEDAEQRIKQAEERVKRAEANVVEHQNRLMDAVIAEKNRADELVAAERLRSDKAIEEKNNQIEFLQGMRNNSSQKGGVYEQKINNCVVQAFGTANTFDILDKKYESGDHIVAWESYKLMIEDKDKKEIDAEDIRKAHRDFTNHSECHLLIFISARAHIPRHQRPGDIDIAIVDGRPVIYIGNFNNKENKILYLQSLQPVIRTLIELTKKAAEGTDIMNEKLSDKLRSIRQHFIYNEQIINDMVNKARAAERNIKGSLDELMLTLTNVQSAFKNSMLSIVNDDDTTVPEMEETVMAEPEPLPLPSSKASGKRSIPKKKSV